MRKLIAVALCLVLVLSVGGTTFAASAAETYGIAPWSSAGGPAHVTKPTDTPETPFTWGFEKILPFELINNRGLSLTEEEAHSGFNSVKVEVDDQWCSGSFYIGQIASPNTMYKFSLWIKATEEIVITINQDIEDALDMEFNTQMVQKKISSKDGWVEFKGFMDTTDALVIRAEFSYSKPHTVLYYDDFSFTPVSWSFENKISDSLLNPVTGEISKDEARKGKASGKISYDRDEWKSGGIYLDKYMEPDKSYELTVWVKATEQLEYALMVDFETEPGVYTQTQLERKTISPGDGWVRMRGKFSTSDALKAVPYIETSKSKTVFYVDDISLIEQEGGKVRIKSDGFVNVRSEGNMNGKVVTRVNNGDELTSTGRTDSGWYIIVLPDGTTGYITDKYIVPLK